ncbi:MAG: flagellar biosynthetic protein FliR [Caldimicrobium sp.]
MSENLLTLLEKDFLLFFLIFLRILFLFFLFPIFTANFFPTKIKILMALIFALVLTPLFIGKFRTPSSFLELFFFILSDFFLIFTMVLFFRILLGGLQLGGELVGIQMGFGISQTFDPLGGVSMPILSQFLYLIFLLLFFSFNIHHYLIYFLVKSFYVIPPGTFIFKKGIFEILIKKSGLLFEIALKILAPLLVFMLLINIVLAVIGRLIPQINILFVSFPLTLGLGLLFFGIMLFFIPKLFKIYFEDFSKFLAILLKV